MLLIVCALLIVATGLLGNGFDASAQENEEDIDISYLATDSALIGYCGLQTRGIYLADGYSIINRIASGKLGAGGGTDAAIRCKVSVTSIVERQTSTGWAYVTAWTQTNENAFSAVVSKSLIVAKGNWYRVRSSHYASTDVSSSNTSALWMGN